MARKAAKGKMQILRTGRCRAGFTLLELIIVIFVISISLAVVFPSFYGFGEKEIKADARRIASVLRYLNDSALAKKDTYSLKFDLEENTVSWYGPDGGKTEKLKSLSSIEIQSKGEVKEGQVVIFFNPLGIEESIAIYLQDGEERMSVTLNSISGRVKIMHDER